MFFGENCRFETSEMLGRFLASTHLMSESWKMCARDNMGNGGFMCDEVDRVVYFVGRRWI